ncbi:MAG TPA: nuclear transport factor 2 family protein [Terracidiphilus sp.]|nr:nuclear transport factor 2 family protein [Terracidiphilus sp.]
MAAKYWRVVLGLAVGSMMWGMAGTVWGQLPLPGPGTEAPNPLTDTTATPGKTLLYNLEAQFEKAVTEKGGAGFASWFADDGMILGNGAAPVVGKVAIEQSAAWSPKSYQLTWRPDGAWMNAAADSGYTWGHYDGHSKDANGNPVVVSGRYITLWGKQADGSWKVEMDASANEPPAAGDCCKLPGK